jgi:uncharacterized membrane protein
MNGTKPLSFLIAIVCVFVVMLLVALLGPAIFNNPDLELDETGVLRFVYVGVGLLIVFLFSYLFNGTVFAVPSVSQVALRPAIAIPMFFGYAFGPVVGLFTGAVGNMFGDALTGFSLSPQWSIGNGLVGMISGMIALYADRKRVMDIVMYISAALAAIATLLWIFNPELSNMMFYDPDAGIFGDATISAFAGLSAVIGFVLVVVVRLLFREDLDMATAVTWAMLGNFVGIGFAALSDIQINGFSPQVAIVGEFLPAAGPNMIFAVILVPILIAAYRAFQRQTGR